MGFSKCIFCILQPCWTKERPTANFNNNFPFIIRIPWTFHFIGNWLSAVILLQNFAHATTAVLSSTIICTVLIHRNGVTAKQICNRIWILSEMLLVKWAPCRWMSIPWWGIPTTPNFLHQGTGLLTGNFRTYFNQHNWQLSVMLLKVYQN